MRSEEKLPLQHFSPRMRVLLQFWNNFQVLSAHTLAQSTFGAIFCLVAAVNQVRAASNFLGYFSRLTEKIGENQRFGALSCSHFPPLLKPFYLR